MTPKIKYLFMLASLAVVVLFSQSSCKKTTPAIASITVTDTLSKAVAGAKVVLKNDSVTSPVTGVQADKYQEGITDTRGKVDFTFELEAVLFVEVSKGALFEKDYIRLEQSKTVEKTIILK